MNKQIKLDIGNASLAYSIHHDNALPHKHCHGDYELIFILSGSGVCTLEGATFRLAPGSVLLVPPYKYHSIEDVGESIDGFYVSFSREGITPETYAILTEKLLGDGDSCCYLASIELHNVSSVFERLKYSVALPEAERVLFVKLVLSEAIVLLSTSRNDPVFPDEGELGVRVLAYINENIDMDMSLDKLAKRFFVSKFYLCRAFKRHNGISVHGYITEKRLTYAKSLIESGESASGAAYRVGFGDYSAFYRAYVKAFGHSPTVDTVRKEGKNELRSSSENKFTR